MESIDKYNYLLEAKTKLEQYGRNKLTDTILLKNIRRLLFNINVLKQRLGNDFLENKELEEAKEVKKFNKEFITIYNKYEIFREYLINSNKIR